MVNTIGKINIGRLDPIYQKEYEAEKAEHRKITKREWLEIFPEAQNYLEHSLLDNLELLEKLKVQYGEELDRANGNDDVTREFLEQMAYFFTGEDIRKAERKIKTINQYLGFLAGIEVPGRITQDDIDRAKACDWENLLKPVRRHKENHFTALCPFHQEKTASFLVKNGFGYCFGCQWQGDSIKFLMQLENISFIEAVKKLY